VKTCPKCNETKELTEFTPCKDGEKIRYYNCRKCHTAITRAWKHAHKPYRNKDVKKTQKRRNKESILLATKAHTLWNAEDIEKLKDKTKTDKELAKMLGRSNISVIRKRVRIGVNKNVGSA